MPKSRSDLIALVAKDAELNTGNATQAVDATLSAIRELASEDKLTIRGFGTFQMKTRAARTGRDLKTGLPIEIPATTTLTFRAAKTKA